MRQLSDDLLPKLLPVVKVPKAILLPQAPGEVDAPHQAPGANVDAPY